jgi:hypothetical protein
MKTKTNKPKIAKTFKAGEIEYPISQLEKVMLAQVSGKPLPTPKRP